MKEVEVKIHLDNGFFAKNQSQLSLDEDYNFFLEPKDRPASSIYTTLPKLRFSIELKEK